MIFWSLVSLLPREDFDPWYIRPFENFFKSRGILPGIGPFARENKENNNNNTQPQENEYGYEALNKPRILAFEAHEAYEASRQMSNSKNLDHSIEGLIKHILQNIEDNVRFVSKRL